MGIGTNLKLALKEYDLTVAELSRKTGISTNTFYAMIRRDNNKISPEMLKKICDNTDITVYDLLDNYDELAAKYYDPNLQKLYEVAMQKALCHEELTKEEKQVIIDIPGQLRQKDDSYENSYSFASSEEELNKILKQCQKQREELLLNNYRKLNELGQLEAKKRVSELTEIPRYTKPDEPLQE